MGTNYYLHLAPCECCGREDKLHIGKDNKDIPFTLRTYSYADAIDTPLRNWVEWRQFIRNNSLQQSIYDEDGKKILFYELEQLVLKNEHGVIHWSTEFC